MTDPFEIGKLLRRFLVPAYNPERDISSRYLKAVRQWIESAGEVFVVLRYLCAGGMKEYAIIRSYAEFLELIRLCPEGTDIVVFRDRQLPVRGVVDDEFIGECQRLFADGMEYLIVYLSCGAPGEAVHPGSMGESHVDLIKHLDDARGDSVAVGPCPRFVDADNEAMISASKGGIDGPR
jgi:hypothetical protein